MNIDTSGAYSPDKIYGQLTMPFDPKTFNVNSHTPYDPVDEAKEDDEAVTFTLKDFRPDQAFLKVGIDEMRDVKGIDISEYVQNNPQNNIPSYVQTNFLNDGQQNGVPNTASQEFPPETPNISSFSLSNLDSHDIVHTALNNGFTTDQAVAMSKAMRAYSIEAAKTPMEALNNTAHKVF